MNHPNTIQSSLEPFEPFRRYQEGRVERPQEDFDYDAAVEAYTKVFDSAIGSTAVANTFFIDA